MHLLMSSWCMEVILIVILEENYYFGIYFVEHINKYPFFSLPNFVIFMFFSINLDNCSLSIYIILNKLRGHPKTKNHLATILHGSLWSRDVESILLQNMMDGREGFFKKSYIPTVIFEMQYIPVWYDCPLEIGRLNFRIFESFENVFSKFSIGRLKQYQHRDSLCIYYLNCSPTYCHCSYYSPLYLHCSLAVHLLSI